MTRHVGTASIHPFARIAQVYMFVSASVDSLSNELCLSLSTRNIDRRLGSPLFAICHHKLHKRMVSLFVMYSLRFRSAAIKTVG